MLDHGNEEVEQYDILNSDNVSNDSNNIIFQSKLIDEDDDIEKINEPILDKKTNNVRRHIIGFILIVIVVFLWVFSGIITQFIFTTENFNKPFFLTYFSTSMFTFYLLGFVFKWKDWGSIKFNKPIDQDFDPKNQKYRFSLKEILKISLSLCFIWFLANYTYNLSLARTSVSTNTILSTLSGIFALFLSILLKVDTFSIEKLIATIFTLVGIVLVSYSDIHDDNGSDTIMGDILAIIGAFLYGLYGVLLKKLIVSEEHLPVPMFLGFLGLFNFLFLWPFFIVLNLLKFEYFELPDYKVLLFLLFNGIFGSFISDLLDSYSVVMTSPIINSIGLSLSIPFAMISDFILKKSEFSFMYIIGSVLVIFGFVLANLASSTFESKLKQIESNVWKKILNVKSKIFS